MTQFGYCDCAVLTSFLPTSMFSSIGIHSFIPTSSEGVFNYSILCFIVRIGRQCVYQSVHKPVLLWLKLQMQLENVVSNHIALSLSQ